MEILMYFSLAFIYMGSSVLIGSFIVWAYFFMREGYSYSGYQILEHFNIGISKLDFLNHWKGLDYLFDALMSSHGVYLGCVISIFFYAIGAAFCCVIHYSASRPDKVVHNQNYYCDEQHEDDE